MIAKVYSAIPYGYEGSIVEVEGDISKSLPSFNIVGMANKTISESRERVRSAIVNSDFTFPDKKVTINLAPAELAKDGSHLDLPIALAILVLSKQLLQFDLENRLFIGELSLDGIAKPVRGIINVVEIAKTSGFKEVYVPYSNLDQAQLVSGITVIGFHDLTELFLHLKGVKPINNSPSNNVHVKNTQPDTDTLDDVIGQDFAKRALTIAVAGRHNILLNGPPGAGKSLLARVAANLLPTMSPTEQISATKLHSLSNIPDQLVTKRPFRSPHHTASAVSIIGGGPHATPGEISLAHHGVLFLDEIPEYPRSVLEALRQPLEDRQITISRTNIRATYPADFMLIATMNPCPCGYLTDPSKPCTCTTTQIENYKKRLSGPIIDRIDLIINVEKVDQSDLISSISHVKNTKTDKKSLNSSQTSNEQNVKNTTTGKTIHSTQHEIAKTQIINAIEIQRQRYNSETCYNSNLSSRDISVYVKITSTGKSLLNQAITTLGLSARSYFKLIKIAQTIADLESSTEVTAEHISEAISLRQQLI